METYSPSFGKAKAYKVAPEQKVHVGQARHVVLDRARLGNDLLNTSTASALVSGFALNSLQNPPADEFLDLSIYVLNCFAVHMCTCSCLTSVFLYHKANDLPENEVHDWAQGRRFLFMLPITKFAMGCVCYLLGVVSLSYRDLAVNDTSRKLVLVVGVLSVTMVFLTAGLLFIFSGHADYFNPETSLEHNESIAGGQRNAEDESARHECDKAVAVALEERRSKIKQANA